MTTSIRSHPGLREFNACLPSSSSSWCSWSFRVLPRSWYPSSSLLEPSVEHSRKRPAACDLLARPCTLTDPASTQHASSAIAAIEQIGAYLVRIRSQDLGDLLSGIMPDGLPIGTLLWPPRRFGFVRLQPFLQFLHNGPFRQM